MPLERKLLNAIMSCSHERAIIKSIIVKYKFRSTMAQERLHLLMIIFVKKWNAISHWKLTLIKF